MNKSLVKIVFGLMFVAQALIGCVGLEYVEKHEKEYYKSEFYHRHYMDKPAIKRGEKHERGYFESEFYRGQMEKNEREP